MVKLKKILTILCCSFILQSNLFSLLFAQAQQRKSVNPYARAAQRKKEQIAQKQPTAPTSALPIQNNAVNVTVKKQEINPPASTSTYAKHNHPELPPLAKVIQPEYNIEMGSGRQQAISDEARKEKLAHEKEELQRLERPVTALYPKLATSDPTDTIEVNLQETDFLNFLQWIESIYQVKFISGDDLNPAGETTPKAAGKKITYKTHAPLTKKQVWDLFLELIYLFGLTPIANAYEQDYPTRFTLLSNQAAKNAAVPAFVGLDWRKIPTIDSVIRYVYFVENSQVAAIFNIVKDLVSPKASILYYTPLNAIIFTDIASNIKAIMEIVAELDAVTMPEALSVLKLKHANAAEVVRLYNELVAAEVKDKQGAARFFMQQRRGPSAVYFPENTRLIAEPRTNALIILGNREGIEKVENFIINYVDTELKQPYSPLYVYELQYANADNIADILNSVTNFGRQGTNIDQLRDAAQYGGVRDGDKFFRKMTFIAEPSGNRLLIKAEKEDYLKVRDIIRKLDVKQPQVAIEVLIVNVLATKVKELGAQIRNKRSDTLGKNVDFQTSGVRNPDPTNEGIIVRPDNGSIMSNLVQLASGQNVGSTLISIGSQAVGGVWALFKALETYVYTNVVSHPFLTTTNKYTAKVALGETRRVQTGTVQGSGSQTQTQDDVSANLSVSITPQINSDGIITLNIEININNFTDADVPSSARRDTKVIKTIANVANGEILAIGGLLKTRSEDATAKVPMLGDIPILGWFFKDKQDTRDKDNLLVFISPQIVEPQYGGGMSVYTKNKVKFSKDTLCETRQPSENRDPIHQWFFNHPEQDAIGQVDDYLEKADYCNRDVTNWWDATPGCPPKHPGEPLLENLRDTISDPSIMASNKEETNKNNNKSTRSKRRSMLEFLPSDDAQEVIT